MPSGTTSAGLSPKCTVTFVLAALPTGGCGCGMTRRAHPSAESCPVASTDRRPRLPLCRSYVNAVGVAKLSLLLLTHVEEESLVVQHVAIAPAVDDKVGLKCPPHALALSFFACPPDCRLCCLLRQWTAICACLPQLEHVLVTRLASPAPGCSCTRVPDSPCCGPPCPGFFGSDRQTSGLCPSIL